MKNIGIITYHCVPNFGAQLQVLSTIGYLRAHGFNPIVLNWFPQDLEDYYKRRVPGEQFECQFSFSQVNMPVSRLCRSLSDLANEISNLSIDGIIIGSDALFDYTPEKLRYNFSIRHLKRIPLSITSNHRLPNPFWGSFNDILSSPVPVAGLSISSQNMPYSKLSRTETAELRRLLSYFSVLSVRDQWTKQMVESITDRKDIIISPDPVFAFNVNYDNAIPKKEICKKFQLPDHYYLISFLYRVLPDIFINAVIKRLESDTNTECVSFPMPDGLRRFDTSRFIELPVSAVEWYYLIKYSDGYIGERMHPIVVSLHNSVPFFCFDQYGTYKTIIPRLYKQYIPNSSKVFDILSKAHLLGNMCPYDSVDKLSPELVVNRLLSFDKKACNAFSQEMQESFMSNMAEIVSIF